MKRKNHIFKCFYLFKNIPIKDENEKCFIKMRKNCKFMKIVKNIQKKKEKN